MKRYLVKFDSMVTSEPYIVLHEAECLSDVDYWAWKTSQMAGLSEGNYEIFEEVLG